jgi:uncharacterized protein DUF6714
MNAADVVRRAFDVFHDDVAAPPPLTLRGANEVDSYRTATPFDPAVDEPIDSYVEGFAFWGVGYLDARSWRHYLPRLMDYALRCPTDPAMVTEALVRSLRPPDRYPPRLGALTPEQETVVRSFLEFLALGDAVPHLQAEAQQALEEWWLPNPRCRPSADEIAEMRATPMTYRDVAGDVYRLALPDTLTGGDIRDIPQESRRVQTWGGYLCGDVHTVVAINVTPLEKRSLETSIQWRTILFPDPVSPHTITVRGSRQAERLDGLTHGDSPAEPQDLTIVFAVAGTELVTLTIRTWTRDDVRREVERIVQSFECVKQS